MEKIINQASRKFGQSLVELLLIIGLSAIVLPSLITGLVSSRNGRPQQNQRLQATTLMKETVEAVRNVREKGWNSFAVNGTYHPVISSSAWSLATGSAVLNGFTQQLVISDVSRNSSGVIVTTGGTVDPSTKKVVVTISWTSPNVSSVSSTLYLTRYLDNITHIETSAADFNAGTKTSVTVTSTSGGEVVLGGGGHGTADWCAPDLSITALDLPKNGVANAITAIEGHAFAGTGENASGVSFANILISNTYPPAASISGTYDCCKTNDVFGETNYAYLATDTNSKEIVIVDLSTTPYVERGYFDATGSTDANSVFVVGNTGYMTQGDQFRIFDLSSKSGSRNQLGSAALAGTGTSVYVVGNYAYVSISGASTRELQILDVSNTAVPSIIGYADLDSAAGQDVYINATGTRAYVATAVSGTQKELFIIDVSTKTGARSLLGSYEANGMNPKGIRVVTSNKAILVGTSGEEYQVIDITNETAPTRCGGMQVNTGINGVSSVVEADGDTYSYIITGDATSEFKIIEGGPSGQFSFSGTFESATFGPGSGATYYNRLSATISKPSQTDITLQVAVADAINGSCTGVTYNFVGPDGTSGTYFTSTDNATIVGQIPADDNGTGYENPGRCMRYKAFLSTTDETQSPTLYDVTINYSP